jgi:signal transduction histidine kinase
LLDGLFLSALTLVTGGYQSFLYWLFPGLIIRTAVSVPRATSQLALNFTIIACYVVAGIINISIAKSLQEESAAIAAMRRPLHHAATSAAPSSVSSALSSAPAESLASHPLLSAAEIAARAPFQFSQNSEVEEAFAENSGLFGSVNDPAQPLELRLLLLVLITLCCYGVQVLLERQRMAEEEAREFAVREGQLRSAGRLAAEFAHQIKNPLAIINNAVFSLRRAAKEGKPLAHAQLEIIEEEVQKSDRIITELMGYAQLSEGRVERINVTEELDRAIAQVFPAAAAYPVKIHRDFAPNLPPLLMQRRHAAETFLNLLQNGREALDAKGGHIFVTARCRHDYAIEVTIADDGPGIAPSRQELVFEAYYTTKTKGTGLGLASVKNNVELYGGSVRVESELGKGARFVLVFPARTLIQTT